MSQLGNFQQSVNVLRRGNMKDFKVEHDNENYSKEVHVALPNAPGINSDAPLHKEDVYDHTHSGIKLSFEHVPTYANIIDRLPHKNLDENGQDVNYIDYSRPINIYYKK